MEGQKSDEFQPRNPSSFANLHKRELNLRNRINLSRLELPAQNTSRFSKTERSLRDPNLKGVSNNARLRSVSRPKGAKGMFKRRGSGNHLQHRLLTDTARSSHNSKARSSTSNEDCTLRYCKCQKLPYYNPYALHYISKNQINTQLDTYFIEGEHGVTMYQKGKEPVFASTKSWNEQRRNFSLIKEKHFFLYFQQRKIFNRWKKTFRRHKFHAAAVAICKTLFLFSPNFNECIYEVQKLLQGCRKVITNLDFENLSRKGCDLKQFLESLTRAGERHRTILKSYKRKIYENVYDCCMFNYSKRKIPIEGYVHLIDKSKRRNLQQVLKRFIKLIESYLRANLEEMLIKREKKISEIFTQKVQATPQVETAENNLASKNNIIFLNVHGEVDFESQEPFKLRPQLSTIIDSIRKAFDNFLLVSNEFTYFKKNNGFTQLLGVGEKKSDAAQKFDVLLSAQELEESAAGDDTIIVPTPKMRINTIILENREQFFGNLTRTYSSLRDIYRKEYKQLKDIVNDRNKIKLDGLNLSKLANDLRCLDSYRKILQDKTTLVSYKSFTLKLDNLIQSIDEMCFGRLSWLQKNLFGIYKHRTTSFLQKLQDERSVLDKKFGTLSEICCHNEMLSEISRNSLTYPDNVKAYDAMWEIMAQLSIEATPGAYDTLSDIRREIRALKLQISLCERQQAEIEQEKCNAADAGLQDAKALALDTMDKVQSFSEASVSSHDEAVAFSVFLQQSTAQIESAAAHIMVCIRLKESYGVSVNKSKLELVFSLKDMLVSLNKSFGNIVSMEKNVIFRNRKKYIHSISIEKDFGENAMEQSLQNLEHSQKLMEKFNAEETKHLFRLGTIRAHNMIHFFKILKILQKSNAFKTLHWKAILDILQNKKMTMYSPKHSKQHHAFKKRPSLMGDESFTFRRSINIEDVHEMVRRHLDKFYKIYENAKGEQDIQEQFSKTLKMWHNTSFSFEGKNFKFLRSSVLLLQNAAELQEKIDEAMLETGRLMTSKYFKIIAGTVSVYRQHLQGMESSLAIILRNEELISKIGNMLSFEYVQQHVPAIYSRFNETLDMWNRCATHSNMLIDDLHYTLKNANFNFEDDDFEIYENLVNIEKDTVYLFKETSSFIQTIRETFPRYYFLSDMEVIEATAACVNLDDDFCMHLHKLFPSVVEVIHDSSDKENPLISALVSQNEVLVLDRVLRLRREGLRIFSTIEKHMQSSLRMEVISTLSKNEMTEFLFKDDIFVTFQDEASQTLKPVTTIQVVLGTLNSKMFMLIEKAFAEQEASNNNALKNLLIFVRTEIQRLLKAYFSVHTSFSEKNLQVQKPFEMNRNRFGLLLECMTHHCDYLQILCASESYDANNFLYFNKPKCKINVTEGGNNVEWNITCGPAIIPYGYEFTGDKASSFAFDTTTERALYFAFQGFKCSNTYLMVDDDPTTSLSEYVAEQLSYYLGKRAVGLETSLRNDVKAVKQKMVGCMKTGAIFFIKNIYNCAPATLQMIASVVSVVQKSFKGTSNYVELDGDVVKPQPTFMFIASLPASIRQDRYSTIKSLFTTCYIRLPNQYKICEILIHRAGFLSRRISTLLKQSNISIAEKQKIESVQSNVCRLLDSLKQTESDWFYRIKHFIKSMTTSINNINPNRTQSLASTLENNVDSNFGEEVRQIMLSLDTFSAVTLCGPSRSGKSTIIQFLIDKFQEVTKTKAKVWKIFPGAYSPDMFRKINNAVQTTNCWVILDGVIKPYIIESLSAKCGEVVQTGEYSSSNTKFILETSNLKDASPTYFYMFPNSHLMVDLYQYNDHLQFWYEKKISESKSIEETTFLELILRHFEQKKFISDVNSHSKHPVSRNSICLLRCLDILELVWKTLLQNLERYDVHSLAARAFCYCVTWGVGAIKTKAGKLLFSKAMLKYGGKYVQHYEPGEIDRKNEEFSFFQLPLIPEMFDENTDHTPSRTDTNSVSPYLFCVDFFMKNVRYIRNLALRNRKNLLIISSHENKKFKQFVLTCKLPAGVFHLQKTQISSFEDVPTMIDLSFDKHTKNLYDGNRDKRVLLFIEDCHVGKDGEDVTPLIEILRSFAALNGFFDKRSLQITRVRRYNMILSAACCLPLNNSIASGRSIDNVLSINLDVSLHLQQFFADVLLSREIRHSTNNTILKHIGIIEEQIEVFNANIERILLKAFDSNTSTTYLQFQLSAKLIQTLTSEPSGDTNSLIFNVLNCFSSIECPLVGIPLSERLDYSQNQYCPKFDKRKICGSNSATQGSMKERRHSYREKILNRMQSAEVGHSHSSVSLSSYLASFSEPLLDICVEIMDIVESNNLLIYCKDNHATLDHLIEDACIATGKEFHCACLGPVSAIENTDLLLSSLANCVIENINTQFCGTIVLSVTNAHCMDSKTLTALLGLVNDFQCPCLYTDSYDQRTQGEKSLNWSLLSYIEEHVENVDLSSRRQLYGITAKVFQRLRLVLQVPYCERLKIMEHANINIFEHFRVLCVPIMSKDNKVKLVYSLLDVALGEQLSKSVVRKLSNMFVDMDEHLWSNCKSSYTTFKSPDILILLESIECFVKSYQVKKKTLEIDRRGIEAGLSQLISGITAEKDIQLQINKIQENLKAARSKIEENRLENPTIQSQIADATKELAIQEKVSDSLVNTQIGDKDNLNNLVLESQRSLVTAIEKIRSIEKQELVNFAGSKSIVKHEAQILYTCFDILQNQVTLHKTKEIRIRLKDPHFQSKIIKCRVRRLSQEIDNSVRSLLNELPTGVNQNWNPICKILLEWIQSLFDFNVSMKRIAPIQNRLDLLQEEICNQKAIVDNILTKIKGLNIKLKVNDEAYSKNCCAVKELLKDKLYNERKLSGCKKIMSWLNMQSNNWKKKIKRIIDVELPSLVASTFVCFGCLPYVSCMSAEERTKFRSSLPKIYGATDSPQDRLLCITDDMEFGGLNDIEKHELEAAGMPRTFACCTVSMDIIYKHGISVLIDPQRCAARYLECALGSDKVIRTYLNDAKLSNKLILAVTNGMTILVQCKYDDYLTKDLWFFFTRDPGNYGNEVLIDSKLYRVKHGFRVFISMGQIPLWHHNTFHTAAIINFRNNTMLPNQMLTLRKQKLLISISMDMLERRVTEDNLFEKMLGKSIILLCEDHEFLRLVEKVLSTDKLLHDRLHSAITKLDANNLSLQDDKISTKLDGLSQQKIDLCLIPWVSNTTCCVADFMDYVSLVEDSYHSVPEEFFFYIGQQNSVFYPSGDSIDDLTSVYFTIEKSMHKSQLDKYSGMLRAIKDRVDNNLSWPESLEVLKVKKDAKNAKKKFFRTYRIKDYSKSTNSEGRLSMRGSLRMSFKSGLGSANSSFIVGGTNPRDADSSKKSIYLLSSMPVKEHPVLSSFNIRSYNDNSFTKAIGHSTIKSLLHWYDMTKELPPKLEGVWKAWSLVLHLSHWAVVVADPTMESSINQISTTKTMSLLCEFIFNYFRKHQENCYDLLGNKRGIKYIVGIMSTLYSSEENLELLLLQYMHNSLEIVRARDFLREPRNVWWLIQDKILKFIPQNEDMQKNNNFEKIVQKLKERIFNE